ncbi:MAG: flippase-like domain-containing protein [Nanoarchaeota archaeon]|nr:flippase-like domain-containing protein [Nanoarchaeota archaeon]
MDKKNQLTILRVMISIALIIFILLKVDLYRMLTGLKSVNPVFILLAFSTMVISLFVRSFLWKTSLSVQKIKVPFRFLIYLNIISSFFNHFLPTSMGGDIVKAYKLSKYSKKNVKSITTVIVNRMSGFFALITLSVLGVILGFELIKETKIAIIVFTLLFISIACILFIFNRRLVNKFGFIKRIISSFDKKGIVKQFYESFYIYKSNKKKALFIYAIALLSQTIVMFYYLFIISSLSLNVPFLYLMIVVPIISILEMLPISLNGLGVREGAALFFFTKIGIDPASAVLIGIIIYMLRVFVGIIGGLVYAFSKR